MSDNTESEEQKTEGEQSISESDNNIFENSDFEENTKGI